MRVALATALQENSCTFTKDTIFQKLSSIWTIAKTHRGDVNTSTKSGPTLSCPGDNVASCTEAYIYTIDPEAKADKITNEQLLKLDKTFKTLGMIYKCRSDLMVKDFLKWGINFKYANKVTEAHLYNFMLWTLLKDFKAAASAKDAPKDGNTFGFLGYFNSIVGLFSAN